jgi:hypothetical protein
MSKFRLLTERDFKMLKNMKGMEDMNETTANVLDSSLPDEIKNMLYQDILRQLKLKQDEQERKPMLVKSSSPPPTPPVPTPSGLPLATPKTMTIPPPPRASNKNSFSVPTPHRPNRMSGKREKLTNFFYDNGFLSDDGELQFGEKRLGSLQTHVLMRALTDGRANNKIEGFKEALQVLKNNRVPLGFVANARRPLLEPPARRNLRLSTYKD